jgi:hypothetical protein
MSNTTDVVNMTKDIMITVVKCLRNTQNAELSNVQFQNLPSIIESLVLTYSREVFIILK